MKRFAANLSLLLFSVLCHTIHTNAQVVTEDWLKSEYTILLSGYFSWPAEEMIDTFRVGVLASEGVYAQMSLKSEMQTLKEKPFQVSYFRKIGEIRPVDILYVDEKKNNSLKKLFNRLNAEPVLLVTDSANNSAFVMLNLLGMNLAGDKPFQLNKINIEKAGLKVSPKILLVGGNEDDLRDIYHELEIEENKLKSELDTLNHELERKQAELTESEEKLEKRTVEVMRLVNEIEMQTEQLSTLSDSVNLKQMDLLDKVRLLARQEDRIKERESEIQELNHDITLKEQEVAERSRTIEKQLEDISRQTEMMEEQQNILDSQKIQIERQKMVLWFFLILSVLVMGLGFVGFRAYQIKKRANRILREKNQVIQEQKSNIMNQKEEIQAQRDALQLVNKKIEKQNANITDSIYYALTIQQAILPDVDEMKKQFEGFIIYMPKDIVSGDFYWFARGSRKRSGEVSHFVAVVDCTGHGVPGGFLSMIGSRMLDAIVNEYKMDQTDEILEMMDRRIKNALNQHKTENEDGMDICLCKITMQGEEEGGPNVYLSFSGARRPLFLMRQGKEVEVVRGDRRTIGGKHFNPNPFSKNELALRKGDRIYLTSDGLMDQHSPEREKFGTKRFVEFLNEHATLSINDQQSRLEEQMMGFMKLEKQRDDITIIGFKL